MHEGRLTAVHLASSPSCADRSYDVIAAGAAAGAGGDDEDDDEDGAAGEPDEGPGSGGASILSLPPTPSSLTTPLL